MSSTSVIRRVVISETRAFTKPVTLDKGKRDTERSDRVLFLDARHIYRQIDRAHREFSDGQIQNIAVISHLYRGEREKFTRLIDRYFEQGMEKLIKSNWPKKTKKRASATLRTDRSRREGPHREA